MHKTRLSKHNILSLILEIQIYSEKCTGRYFIERDDDLSSKQGSLCTFKIIQKLLKNILKYIFAYIYIFYKI
jgi:hypothetical protein